MTAPMTDPAGLRALAQATIAYLNAQTPWLADKVGGTLIYQSVLEAWAWIKARLTASPAGKAAVEQLGSAADPAAAAESLREPLLAAIAADPAFAARLQSLVVANSDAQIAIGNNIKLAKVANSADVRISIG